MQEVVFARGVLLHAQSLSAAKMRSERFGNSLSLSQSETLILRCIQAALNSVLTEQNDWCENRRGLKLKS